MKLRIISLLVISLLSGIGLVMEGAKKYSQFQYVRKLKTKDQTKNWFKRFIYRNDQSSRNRALFRSVLPVRKSNLTSKINVIKVSNNYSNSHGNEKSKMHNMNFFKYSRRQKEEKSLQFILRNSNKLYLQKRIPNRQKTHTRLFSSEKFKEGNELNSDSVKLLLHHNSWNSQIKKFSSEPSFKFEKAESAIQKIGKNLSEILLLRIKTSGIESMSQKALKSLNQKRKIKQNSDKVKKEKDRGVLSRDFGPSQRKIHSQVNSIFKFQKRSISKFKSENRRYSHRGGNFDNVHISRILILLTQIQDYLVSLLKTITAIHACLRKNKDTLSKDDYILEQEILNEIIDKNIEKDFSKIQQSFADLENIINPDSYNFHNVLNFFNLKSKFEDIKIKVDFDHNFIDEFEENLFREVDRVVRNFNLLRLETAKLKNNHLDLLKFIKGKKKFKISGENENNYAETNIKALNTYKTIVKSFKLGLQNNIEEIKEIALTIKLQKLVFDKIFHDSLNKIQQPSKTKSSWISSITVGLILISAALLI
jgi:hypothetical protein